MRRIQSTMGLPERILLGAFVILTLVVFSANIMKYNEIKEETAKVEAVLDSLTEKQARLESELGSAEKLKKVLSDYKLYSDLLNSGTEAQDALEEYDSELRQLRDLLKSSPYSDVLERIAREKLNLYYPDEEIIYNDRNQ